MVSLSRQLALASLTGLALLGLCAPVWATDGAIRNIRYDQGDRHFIIDTSGPVKAMVNTLNIAGRKRIIIDLDNAEIGVDLPRDVQLLQDLSREFPDVRNVTVNQYGGNGRPIVRVLLDLQGDPGAVRMVRNQGPQIELELSPSAASSGGPSYASPNPGTRSMDMPPSLSSLQQGNSGRSNSDYQDQKRQIDSLQAEIDRLKRELAKNSASALDTDQLKRSLADMNRKYESVLQDNQYLKAQLSTVGQNQDSAQSEQAGLRAEIERLKADNQSLQARVSKASLASDEPALADMKRTLVQMNQRYDQLSQENQRLKSQLETKAPTPAASSGFSDVDLQKLRGQLTLAQQSLNDSIRTINEQNKEIAFLRNQVSDVKAGLDASSKEQIARLQSSLDEKTNTILNLQRQLATKPGSSPSSGNASAELSTIKRQLASMTDQYQGDLRSLNQQLKEKNEQLQNLQAQASRLDELQRENARLQSQLDDANRTIADSQSHRVPATELQKRDNRIVELQKELDSLRANRDSDVKSSSSLKEAMDRMTRENRELQSQVASLNQRQSSASGEQIQQLQKQIASLKQDLSGMTDKYNHANQDANKAKQDLVFFQRSQAEKPAGKSAGKTDPALEKQVADLNRQLADARKENAYLRDSLSSKSSASSAPSNPEAEQDYQEGKVALAGKDIAKALDKLKEAQLLEPDNGRYVTEYSNALAEDHQYPDAIDVLRRYLQKNPVDREAYNQLGKLYLLNDEADAANQAFTRAMSISTLNNYATSLKKLGRMEDAEQVFKLALTLSPKDSEVLFNLGNLYNAENKLELARNKYLEAIQIKPDFAEAHYNLGLIFSKMGDNAKAVTHLEKFLELSPNARNADTIRAYVQKLKV